MSFKTLVKFILMALRQGWYVTRQHMIKNGYTQADIAEVLACTLRHIGLQERGEM